MCVFWVLLVCLLVLVGRWFGAGAVCWLLVFGPCLATLRHWAPFFLGAAIRLYAPLGSSFSLLRLMHKAGGSAVNYCTFLPGCVERPKLTSLCNRPCRDYCAGHPPLWWRFWLGFVFVFGWGLGWFGSVLFPFPPVACTQFVFLHRRRQFSCHF